MFKTETHIHVSEVSPCSKLGAREMVQLYHQAGFKTIFITDHFKDVYFNNLGNIPWKDKVTIFLSGYYKAKEEGRKCGMNVLLGAEVMFEDNPNHYLIYGITKKFLTSYPNFCRMSAEEFYEIAKKHNVFVVQAHPYRDGICYPTPLCVDGMEIINANPRHENDTEKSHQVAKEHDLAIMSGSDAHRLEDIGRTGLLSKKEIKTANDFIKLLKSGKVEFFMRED